MNDTSQSWAGPNKSHTQRGMQADGFEVEWERMKQCSLNIEDPPPTQRKNNITQSISQSLSY